MADSRYQWRTATIHLLVAGVALGGGAWVWKISYFYSAAGLFVGAVTNFLIGWEKLKLLQRSDPRDGG